MATVWWTIYKYPDHLIQQWQDRITVTSDRHYSRIKLVLPQIHIILQTDLISIQEDKGLYFKHIQEDVTLSNSINNFPYTCTVYIYSVVESQMLRVVCTVPKYSRDKNLNSSVWIWTSYHKNYGSFQTCQPKLTKLAFFFTFFN